MPANLPALLCSRQHISLLKPAYEHAAKVLIPSEPAFAVQAQNAAPDLSGILDQITGAADNAAGKAQGAASDVQGKASGAGSQASGKVCQACSCPL